MALWSKKMNNLNESQTLQEASKAKQLDITALLNQPYYQFTSQLTSLRSLLTTKSTIKEAMLKDPIISQIINMWISDTLSKDILTGEIFEVVIEDNASGDKNIKELITDMNTSVKYLRENSNLNEILTPTLYNIITGGITSVRLGFVDMYEDTKIKLFESNKKKFLKESENWNDSDKESFLNPRVYTSQASKLLEAPTYDDYEDNTESYEVRQRRKINKLIGRYYFELMPQKLVPLKHKGITILYLDLNNQVKVLNPRNITTFINTRGGVKSLSIKSDPEDIDSSLYEIPLGKSFIENAVTPWSMYNTVQDCTLLALMTRSAIYRLFQIDVGAMSVKETEQFLQEFKKRLTSRESIDVRAQHYSSAQTQIPLGDSILIPTRNGLGRMEVQAIGGDLNIQTEEPLNFFREELLASLGVSKDLIYGSNGGALVNTSATRSDIRYLRTIQQFISILSLGLESIFKDYLSLLDYDLSKVTLKVIFKQLNSEEALQRMEYEQTRQEALDRLVTSLNNLGIDFSDGKYKTTRNELISRYMDNELLECIKQDELNTTNNSSGKPSDNEATDEDMKPLPPMSDFSNLSDDSPTEHHDTDDIEVSSEDKELPEVSDEVEDTEGEPPYSIG